MVNVLVTTVRDVADVPCVSRMRTHVDDSEMAVEPGTTPANNASC